MIQIIVIVLSMLATATAVYWYDRSKKHHNNVGMATVAVSGGSLIASAVSVVPGVVLLSIALVLWVISEFHGVKVSH